MRRVPEGLPELFVEIWNNERNGGNQYLETRIINLGWCYQFALIMKALYGDRAELWWNWDHAWVVIDGIGYDSSHPEGGVVPRMGYESETVTGSIAEFEQFWRYGGSGQVDWQTIEKVAAVYLPTNAPRETNWLRNFLMSLFSQQLRR